MSRIHSLVGFSRFAEFRGKAASDCTKNANKSPQISHYAMVREVEKMARNYHVTVGDLQPTWCAPVASRNCRRPFILLCWAKALKQSPWWHYIGFIAVSFQKETENSLISAVLSGHYFVVCYGFFCRHRGPWSYFCYLGHVKKCNVM